MYADSECVSAETIRRAPSSKSAAGTSWYVEDIAYSSEDFCRISHRPANGRACTSPDSRCAVQTYKEATFRPSPRLNLILAPNGQPHVLTNCLETKAAPLHAILCILLASQNAWCTCAGAGKSSLTCAMALGLAADPKVTVSASVRIMQHPLI